MESRTRLTNWSLPVLLIGVPLCAALALEHASAAGIKQRSGNQPSQQTTRSSKLTAPAAAPQNGRPLPR